MEYEVLQPVSYVMLARLYQTASASPIKLLQKYHALVVDAQAAQSLFKTAQVLVESKVQQHAFYAMQVKLLEITSAIPQPQP
jgi:hypothetical protein